MKSLQRICVLTTFTITISGTSLCHAAFHLWEIKEIFTNADGTVQFIEMFTTAPGEAFLDTHNIIATSDGVAKEFILDHHLANPTDGKHFLMATAGFATLAGGVAPDYTPLPSNFFNPSAASITFDFAHGWDTLTVAGSMIPKDGVTSLTDADTNSEGGDNLVAGVNSPTNFAGAVGSVNLGGATPTPGDFTGNGVVDGADLAIWRTNFGATGAPTTMQGNADADGDVDGRDLLIWQRNVAAAPAGPTALTIPEPASAMLAALATAALTLHRRRRALNPRHAHRSP
jgi:hypothetical protein